MKTQEGLETRALAACREVMGAFPWATLEYGVYNSFEKSLCARSN
jgi:hypothetical protein